MANKPYQVRLTIPKTFNKTERSAIASDIVSFIQKRTAKGIDMNGNKFTPPYSKGYLNSAAFKQAGKKKSPINLTLSGDMLDALDIVKEKPGEIVIGYEDSSPQAGKAEGNQIGSYGKPDPNPKLARKFLGISKDDLKSILNKYSGD